MKGTPVWVVEVVGGGPVLPTVGVTRMHSIAAYNAMLARPMVSSRYAMDKREGVVRVVRATLTLEQHPSSRKSRSTKR